MFYIATAFDQPIGQYNTGNALTLSRVLSGAKALKQAIPKRVEEQKCASLKAQRKP